LRPRAFHAVAGGNALRLLGSSDQLGLSGGARHRGAPEGPGRPYNSGVVTRWQLRTWTKGTGATVEPAGADDRPPARARPGGLTPMPAKRAWGPGPAGAARPLPTRRVSGAARRRHALGYLEPGALERLERLESELSGPVSST